MTTVWLVVHEDIYSYTDSHGYGVPIPRVLAVCTTEEIADREITRLIKKINYQRDFLSKDERELIE